MLSERYTMNVVHPTMNIPVGSCVGESVGLEVPVGCSVGASDGEGEGAGLSVGDSVGASVVDSLGGNVGAVGKSITGGSLRVGRSTRKGTGGFASSSRRCVAPKVEQMERVKITSSFGEKGFAENIIVKTTLRNLI